MSTVTPCSIVFRRQPKDRRGAPFHSNDIKLNKVIVGHIEAPDTHHGVWSVYLCFTGDTTPRGWAYRLIGTYSDETAARAATRIYIDQMGAAERTQLVRPF